MNDCENSCGSGGEYDFVKMILLPRGRVNLNRVHAPKSRSNIYFTSSSGESSGVPWLWFRPEDTLRDPQEVDFSKRSLAERVAMWVSRGGAFLWCNCVFGPPEDLRDPYPEMQAGVTWLERLQNSLPPHNRISSLLAVHMLELRRGAEGLRWIEIEDVNHPGLKENDDLRNALLNPPKTWQ